ncbi:MAG: AMP-binding protein [Pirellulales bacterium]|nr:AMP-binding protein [Pirellulales bacterium]
MASPRPDTVAELVRSRATSTPHLSAYGCRQGGAWPKTDWAACWAEMQRLASALRGLDVARGDPIAILGKSGRAWHLAEHAVLLAGGVAAGIDPHVPRTQLQAMLAVVSPKLVLYDEDAFGPTDLTLAAAPLIGFRDLLALAGVTGASQAADRPGEPIAIDLPVEISGDDPATVIFTSGATGEPKAIRYTHRQLLAACDAIGDAFPMSEGESTLCWLPMAHLFQRMMNLVAVRHGATIHFVEDPRTLVECAQEAEPSIIAGVPRFFEKLREGIERQIDALPAWRRTIVRAALRQGDRFQQTLAGGGATPWSQWFVHRLCDRLVLSHLRATLGRRVQMLITGSAPIAMNDLRFFDSIGWRVLEAYGVSENAVPIAANRPGQRRAGSVGKPFAANELRIADDGEVLVRGPGVFHGYFNGVRQAGCFTDDGFYRTGDVGRLDDQGFLYLEGRKSEFIKTSTGRKVAPAPLEAVYGASRYLNHCVVVGNGRKHLAALCTLNTAQVLAWRAERGESSTATEEQLAQSPAVRCLIESQFDELGQGLAPHERIHRVAILPRQLSLEAGEITSTLKLRRLEIERRCRSWIDACYVDDERPALSARQS